MDNSKKPSWLKGVHDGGLAGGGGPPHDGDMEQRVAKLAADFAEIKSDLKTLVQGMAEVKAAMATKDDVGALRLESAEMKHAQSEAATKSDLVTAKVEMAEIKGRLQAMPTLWSLVVTNVGLLVAAIGGMAAVFALLGD